MFSTLATPRSYKVIILPHILYTPACHYKVNYQIAVIPGGLQVREVLH
jgi:hypothetical protein